jgi:DNA-binding transcriptional LysR family regulator
VEVETIDQVLPAVRCNLGIGFVPREMLVAVPELTGVYPLTLDEPIAPRSILFQQKNQSLSIAAKHLRQMLLGDRSREVKKLPTQ